MIRHAVPPVHGDVPARSRTIAAFLILLIPSLSMATEEPKYAIVKQDGNIEIRLYEPRIVAETQVDTADFDEGSNEGFRRLAGYIFGGNAARQKIAMTSPVTTESSQKIAMTAPVQTSRQGKSILTAFTMPANFVMESLPVPNDSRVKLRRIPERRFATIKFSGRWTEDNFREYTRELTAWIQKQGLKITGEPMIARYNPPMVPAFLRRNEVLIPVE